VSKKKTVEKQKTITLAELQKFEKQGKDIPPAISVDGFRREWMGIGWRPAGLPKGDEVLVTVKKEK